MPEKRRLGVKFKMSDARVRSPKFPSLTLREAVQEVERVYKAEDRNKMSRSVLAAHLGYSSLSGASASKIGALRHFGLIEGSGDELRVSNLAISLILKEPGTKEHASALKEAVSRPSLYSELLEEYGTKPSLANLEFKLVHRGFLKKSAEKAAQDFLDSAEFAGCWESDSYAAEDSIEPESLPDGGEDFSGGDTKFSETEMPRPRPSEEEVSSGKLSKETKYRLLISGPFGADELNLLIKKLELDKEFLE